MRRISIFALIVSLAIPLAVGGISAAITAKGMAVYGSMSKPPLSPPAWLFPVAWTILYLLMGLASYYIYVSENDSGDKWFALAIYGLQLAMNFMWSIIFFNWGHYFFAFVWLFFMWIIVIFTMTLFYKIDRGASCLLIPYILWLAFAGYLNMGAYILNQA